MTDDILLDRLLQQVSERYPKYTVLLTFRILWDGWELDNRGAIIRVGSQIKLVVTDHGTLAEVDRGFLQARIDEHQAVLGELQRALKAMGG